MFIKRLWTFKAKQPVGRKPVDKSIRLLILDMKNNNLYWGVKKIQGELTKLGLISTLPQSGIFRRLSGEG